MENHRTTEQRGTELKKLSRIVFLGTVLAMAAAGAFGAGTEDAAAPDELPTLTVATHTGWAALLAPASNDLPVYQELERLSGVHIEWENIQVANYAEVMRARLAAAVDLPDVINMSLLGDIGQHGRDGLIIPLNDLLEEYAPNINRWWNTGSNGIYKILDTSPDGNIYGVGNYVLPHYLSQGPLWNRTWLDAVGISEMPETQADLMNALRLFRDNDPNGNGENDEIPLVPAAGRGYLRVLGNLYGFEYSIVSEYLVDDDEQVSWIFQSPRMKEYLTWLNELYTEGLLDKAYATDSWTETLEKVTNDRVGLITCWTTFAGTYSQAHPAGKPDGSVAIFENGPPIEGPYGDKFFVKREIFGGDQMGITKDSKQPEVAMHWIDFIRNGEEALMLQNFGILGDSYRMVDGEIETLGTDDKPFNDRLLEVGGSQPPYAHLQWDFAWDYRFPTWSLANNTAYQGYYKAPSFPQVRPTLDEQEILNRVLTDLNTYKTEWFDKFVTGQEPLSKFDEFVDGLNKLGAADVIAVRQQQYERYGELTGS